MTHSLGTTGGTGSDAGKSRLQLKPNAPASTYLDGTWWPWSTQLEAELPDLVEALSERLGEVAVVGYHRNAWRQTPSQMQIADSTIQLQGFTSNEPASVILIGRDGRRVTLLVLAPSTSEAVAREEFDAASEDAGDSDPVNNRAQQAAARSVTEVAAQLARHEGRGDPQRTAEIAQWCAEAATQFVNAPVQAFVPILVHHIVRNRMTAPHSVT